MAIGDPFAASIPVVGTAGTQYASDLVTFLREVETRLNVQIPLTSLLAGTFDMDNNAVENAQYLALYEQEDTSSEPIGSLFNYQGNLWWVSATGGAQITTGNSLNAASLGTIGGDYGGGNPASVVFVDGDQTFYFYDDYGALEWARLGARSIDLYGTLDEVDRVRITWPGGSNWTLTLPAAPPAESGTLLQMATTGTVTVSNSGLQGLTLANDEDLTLQGAGRLKHGTRIKTISMCPTQIRTGSVSYPSAPSTTSQWQADTGTIYYVALDMLTENETLESIMFKNNHGSGTHVFEVVGITDGGLELSIASTTSSSNSFTLPVNAVVTSDYAYFIKVTAATDLAVFIQARISYSGT
jgi:hypothetical protein